MLILMKRNKKLASACHWLIMAWLIGVHQMAPANEWKQFGGPRGNFGLEEKLSTKGSKVSVLWSRELGFGNSGIVGDAETIFTQFRQIGGNGDASDYESIIALNASKGGTLWRFDYAQIPLAGQENYGGGNGPHSTPCVYKDKIYCVGFSGDLHALNSKSGEVVWHRNLVSEFKATPVQFGFASSPIVHDGRILVSAAGKLGGLLALDPDSGSVIWHSKSAEPSYATPVIDERQGQALIVYLTRDELQFIDPDSGDVVGNYELPKQGLTNVPTPMLFKQNQIFLAGQGAQGAVMIETNMQGDSVQARESWKSKRINFFHQSFVEMNGLIVGGESFLYGINGQSGRIEWKERGFENTNLIKTGNVLWAMDQKGWLSELQADEEEMKTIWKQRLFSEESWTPPTIIGNVIYARSRKNIVALQVNSTIESRDLFRTPLQIEEVSVDLSRKGSWEELKTFWKNLNGRFGAATAATIAGRLESLADGKLAMEFIEQISKTQNKPLEMLQLSSRYALTQVRHFC